MDNILYLYLYKSIKEKTEGRRYIAYAELKKIITHRIQKIPWQHHPAIIKEMEELGLIKKLNRGGHTMIYQITGGKAQNKLRKYGLSFIN